jgi:hypothetical protein
MRLAFGGFHVKIIFNEGERSTFIDLVVYSHYLIGHHTSQLRSNYHNDTHHNVTRHNDYHHSNIQYNNANNNDTYHNDTHHNDTPS